MFLPSEVMYIECIEGVVTTFIMAAMSSKIKNFVTDAGTCVVVHSKWGLSSSGLVMPSANT